MTSRCMLICVCIAIACLLVWAEQGGAQVTLDAMLELYADPVGVGFGYKVAIDGDIAIVGTIFGIFIIERGPGGWIQEAFVDSFLAGGTAPLRVAMEGEVIVVGVPSDGSAGALGAGAVYLIERVGGVWSVTHQLFASDPDQSDHFGASVSIQGEWLVVGAPGDDQGGPGAGAVYAFSTLGWTQQQKLFGSAGASADDFGTSVSVRDGWAAIGTSFDGAYAFRLQGGSWVEEEFFPPPPQPTIFGEFVAAEGPTILVPDPWPETVPGRALIYEFDGVAWSETEIMASNPELGGLFGAPVAIRGGRILLAEVGRDAAGTNSGRASLFQKIGGVWTEVAHLLPSDLDAYNWFGGSLALDDAGHLFIGATGDDTAGPDAGSAYLFFIGDGFRRGDANLDGMLNIADPVAILIDLFGGGPPLGCDDATDANDDGQINLADPIYILFRLFVPSSPPLPAPSPGCGEDPTVDSLDCASLEPCL